MVHRTVLCIRGGCFLCRGMGQCSSLHSLMVTVISTFAMIIIPIKVEPHAIGIDINIGIDIGQVLLISCMVYDIESNMIIS